MRIFIGMLLASAMMCGMSFAGDTDGTITAIDREAGTIVLDNGKTYKLPGEFDPNVISEGMEILIAFDTVNGINLITDMELFE